VASLLNASVPVLGLLLVFMLEECLSGSQVALALAIDVGDASINYAVSASLPDEASHKYITLIFVVGFGLAVLDWIFLSGGLWLL
jgi:hypothetical protein